MLIEKWSCLQKIQEMEAYEGRKKGNPESDSDVSMCGCGVLCAAVTNVWKDGAKTDDTTASFINQIIHYVLPETGGSGTTAYGLGGTALMLSAAVLALVRRKKRRKGDSASL